MHKTLKDNLLGTEPFEIEKSYCKGDEYNTISPMKRSGRCPVYMINV